MFGLRKNRSYTPNNTTTLSQLGLRKFGTPEQYGARGDGVTNDTDAFNRIPSDIKFIILREGSTYLINDECLNSLVKSGCIIEGHFAVIKRADATVTTLTQAAALGATQLHVASTTGWSVGDYITVTNNNAATYAGKGDQENSNRGGDLDTVSAIDSVNKIITITNGTASGLRLPENGELDGAGEYAIGCNVVRTFNMWGLGNENNNIEWRNVIIDGNVSGNDYTYDWRVNNTGSCKGQNIKFLGCQFKNLPSENITVSGEVWFDWCKVDNLTGGLVHGSNADPTQVKNGIWVTNCKGKNVGQRAAQAGHSEGFVTFSASVREVWIIDNDIENELSGSNKTNSGFCFGKVSWETNTDDAYQDSQIYVRGNRFVNFKNITNVVGNTATVQNISEIELSDNNFENCGDLLMRGNNLRTGSAIRNVTLFKNKITNGRLFFEEVYNLKIIHNTLKQKEDYSFPSDIVGLSNVNTVGHIYVAGSQVKMKHNTIVGKTTNDDYCKRGIFLKSNIAAKDSGGVDTNYCYYQDIQVCNNTVRNHHEHEIATSNVTVSTARTLELVGWSVKHNHVFPQKDSSQNLIWVDPGVVCESNHVYTYLSGQVGIRSIGVNASGPITTCRGPVVRNNYVYGPATSPIISQANNNDYNSVITGNILQVELSDPGFGKSYIADNILMLSSTMATPYIVNEDEDTDVY